MKTARRGACPLLFFVFLALKLTGQISWSWWWVTCPLWLPMALGLAVIGLVWLIVFISPADSIDL